MISNDIMKQLIGGFSSNDNNIRKEAEKMYNEAVEKQEGEVLNSLVALIGDADITIRSYTCILLKKIIVKKEVKDYPLEFWKSIQSILLQALLKEDQIVVGKQLVYACSTMKAVGVAWQELILAINEICGSADPKRKELGLLLISALIEDEDEDLLKISSHIIEFISNIIRTPTSEPTLIEKSVSSLCSIVTICNQNSAEWRQISPLFAHVLQRIANLIDSGDEDLARNCFEYLTDIANQFPTFLRQHLQSLFTLCIKVGMNKDLDGETRRISMEVIDCLSENGSGMLRKNKQLLQQYVEGLIQLLNEVEFAEDWENCDNNYDGDMPAFARDILDHFTSKIGFKTMLPFITVTVPNLLTNNDWLVRYTALETLSVFVSSLNHQMEDLLDNIVPPIFHFLEDENIHVKYITLDTFESFIMNFDTLFHEKFFDNMMLAYNKLLFTELPIKLYAKVAQGVEILCGDVEIMKGHMVNGLDLPQFIEKFFVMLGCDKISVEESALSAISALATIYDLSSYYERLMPSLLTLLQMNGASSSDNGEKNLISLKTRVLECIANFVALIPPQNYNTAVVPILQILLSRNNGSPIQYEDPLCADIIDTCGKIAANMKSEFLPYFDLIFPAIRQMASQVIKYEMEEIPENEVDEIQEDGEMEEGVESFRFEKNGTSYRIKFNSTAVEEKMQGCIFLRHYCNVFGRDFFKYMQESLPIVSEMLHTTYYEGLRQEASNTLTSFLKCVLFHEKENCGGVYNDTSALLSTLITALLKQLKIEDDVETITTLLDNLAETVRISYQSGGLKSAGKYNPPVVLVPLDVANNVIEELVERAKESIGRRDDLFNEANENEDFDEETKDELLQEMDNEDAVMINLIDSIGYLLKEHQLALWDTFESKISPFLQALLARQDSDTLPLNALFLYEDSIEHMLPNSKKYVQLTYDLILKEIQIEKPTHVQASIYGLGVIAQHHQDFIHSQPLIEKQMCELIVKYIGGCEQGGEDYIYALENAVSSLCKFLMNSTTDIKNNLTLWEVWLNHLPLVRDSEEAMIDHRVLIDLICNKHPLTTNSNNINQIVKVLLRCSINYVDPDGDEIELLDGECKSKLKEVILALPNSAQVVPVVLTHFTPEEQNKINQVLSS